MRQPLVTSALVACTLLAVACADGLPEQSLLESVERGTIEEGTRHLSSPALGGRGTGQPGADSAAAWIAERFRAVGLDPAGDDGSFLHTVPFLRSRLSPDASMLQMGADTLRPARDFAVLTTPDGDSLDVSGALVFVGYGMRDSATGRDDLRGVDVRDKIVLTLGDVPPGVDTAAFMAATMATQEQLSQARALLVAGLAEPDRPFDEVASRLMRDRVTRVNDEAAPAGGAPLVLAISDEAADRLLQGRYAERKAAAAAGNVDARPLRERVSITLRRSAQPVRSSNVVGLVRGADPALRDEVVVFSAHYDAFGTDANGAIFRGAIDNALGTSQLLAVAEAFARQPFAPRRSVLFLAVTGEEYGLLGTRAWIEANRWPIEQVVAALNFDASDSEVYGPMTQAVGLGAEQSTLGDVFTQAATDIGVTPIADPYPEQGFFFRSDHFAFVQRGVPGLMLIGAPAGTEWVDRSRQWLQPGGDYHQPSDTVRSDWDFRGPLRSAQLMALIGWRVANADQRPAMRAAPEEPDTAPRP